MSIIGKDLVALGWKPGPVFKKALARAHESIVSGVGKEAVLHALESLAQNPAASVEDPAWSEIARELLAEALVANPALAEESARYAVWGADQIDEAALKQMEMACRLPVAMAGAQMPDGHVGYGLPIGGVLATRDAVIPYGVGVDIACRMKLSIVDVDASRIEGWRHKLRRALTSETRFGVGGEFKDRREHDVMDDPLWNAVPKSVAYLRDKAWRQLGTSGSGNHFVEWGELILDREDLGLPAGKYLALLSHSGSRGFGAQIADRYTRVAMEKTQLPDEARRLAWLSLRSEAGKEYWNAMNLAGNYAAANHDLIHRHVLRAAGLKPAAQIENHHNFAWIEKHYGEEVVVHRKGATPAGAGVLGIIPGSMGDPGFVVRGRGNARALESAAHGAGRRMSRTKARGEITRTMMRQYLDDRGVELLAGGVDESPFAYKPIREVMAAQADLVETVAEFRPRMVLMADDGKSED